MRVSPISPISPSSSDMTKRKTYWLGKLDDECQLCHKSFGAVMYDASIGMGPWGNICQRCFKAHGCKLGTGFGQKYELQKNGRWLKVGG